MRSLGNHIKYLGPDTQEGPLPAVFYFALSAEDSLQLDPFNQFVTFLHNYPLRIFSITLPGHEKTLSKENAIKYWIKHMKEDPFFLIKFFDETARSMTELKNKVILPEQCAVAGLSRGAFAAMHIAARLPWIQTILGFAPMTKLTDFSTLDIEHIAPKIANRNIRLYIGSRDTRVGTETCFNLIIKLSNEAHDQRIRNSSIDLIIGPSIGYQGHGTSRVIFKKGADWIRNQILV